MQDRNAYIQASQVKTAIDFKAVIAEDKTTITDKTEIINHAKKSAAKLYTEDEQKLSTDDKNFKVKADSITHKLIVKLQGIFKEAFPNSNIDFLTSFEKTFLDDNKLSSKFREQIIEKLETLIHLIECLNPEERKKKFLQYRSDFEGLAACSTGYSDALDILIKFFWPQNPSNALVQFKENTRNTLANFAETAGTLTCNRIGLSVGMQRHYPWKKMLKQYLDLDFMTETDNLIQDPFLAVTFKAIGETDSAWIYHTRLFMTLFFLKIDEKELVNQFALFYIPQLEAILKDYDKKEFSLSLIKEIETKVNFTGLSDFNIHSFFECETIDDKSYLKLKDIHTIDSQGQSIAKKFAIAKLSQDNLLNPKQEPDLEKTFSPLLEEKRHDEQNKAILAHLKRWDGLANFFKWLNKKSPQQQEAILTLDFLKLDNIPILLWKKIINNEKLNKEDIKLFNQDVFFILCLTSYGRKQILKPEIFNTLATESKIFDTLTKEATELKTGGALYYLLKAAFFSQEEAKEHNEFNKSLFQYFSQFKKTFLYYLMKVSEQQDASFINIVDRIIKEDQLLLSKFATDILNKDQVNAKEFELLAFLIMRYNKNQIHFEPNIFSKLLRSLNFPPADNPATHKFFTHLCINLFGRPDSANISNQGFFEDLLKKSCALEPSHFATLFVALLQNNHCNHFLRSFWYHVGTKIKDSLPSILELLLPNLQTIANDMMQFEIFNKVLDLNPALVIEHLTLDEKFPPTLLKIFDSTPRHPLLLEKLNSIEKIKQFNSILDKDSDPKKRLESLVWTPAGIKILKLLQDNTTCDFSRLLKDPITSNRKFIILSDLASNNVGMEFLKKFIQNNEVMKQISPLIHLAPGKNFIKKLLEKRDCFILVSILKKTTSNPRVNNKFKQNIIASLPQNADLLSYSYGVELCDLLGLQGPQQRAPISSSGLIERSIFAESKTELKEHKELKEFKTLPNQQDSSNKRQKRGGGNPDD